MRVSATGTHPQQLGIHHNVSGLTDGEQLLNNFRTLLDLLNLEYLRQDPDHCLGLEAILEVVVTDTHYERSISAMGSHPSAGPEIQTHPWA